MSVTQSPNQLAATPAPSLAAAQPAGQNPYQNMDPTMALNLHRLIMQVNAMGGNLDIGSGYRSDADQANLFNAVSAQYGPDQAMNWAAPPGASNHTSGMAADLTGSPRALSMAAQMAGQYGLVAPLPNQPWHFEAAGQPQKYDDQGGPQATAPLSQKTKDWAGEIASGLQQAGQAAAAAQNQPAQPAKPAAAGGGTYGNTPAANVNAGNPKGGDAKANQAMGQSMAAAMGWTGAEWTALNNVVMRESGWNANAANPTSNARGIAQNIQGWSQGYQAGNAPQQIQWLISYIKGRYGTPSKAWDHELKVGWY